MLQDEVFYCVITDEKEKRKYIETIEKQIASKNEYIAELYEILQDKEILKEFDCSEILSEIESEKSFIKKLEKEIEYVNSIKKEDFEILEN